MKKRKKTPIERLQIYEEYNKPCPPINMKYFDALIDDSIRILKEQGTAYVFTNEQVTAVKKSISVVVEKLPCGIFSLNKKVL